MSYGVDGFEGTCSVHIDRRKNDTVRKGHYPALGRSIGTETDIVTQLRVYAPRRPRGLPGLLQADQRGRLLHAVSPLFPLTSHDPSPRRGQVATNRPCSRQQASDMIRWAVDQAGCGSGRFSGISARKGGISPAIAAKVDETILYLQSGHGQPLLARVYMHLVALLHALQGPTTQQQLSAIFTDDRWLQERSSAPVQSWVNTIRREGVEPPMAMVDNRRRAAVEMFRALGSSLQDRHKLRRLCVWLAQSFYMVGAPEVNAIFDTIEPLSRGYVSLTTDAGEQDSSVIQIEGWTLVTKGGVITIKEGTSRHIGSVKQGRWLMLAAEQGQADMIRALPGWIAQVEAEERSRGVPSQQFWRGVCWAFQADVIIGCNPLVAPACFKAALCGREGSGWGHQEVKTRQVYNLLCMPPHHAHARGPATTSRALASPDSREYPHAGSRRAPQASRNPGVRLAQGHNRGS